MFHFPKDFQSHDTIPLWTHEEVQEFSYSDGSEVEQFLNECLDQTQDLSSSSTELALHIKDWPSEYHLSLNRANLLKPLNLLSDHQVLELGAGCGAITRYLGEVCGSVVAIEGSIARAQLAAKRCKDLENVQVVCSNFQDVQVDQKFDIVTLIGVLEYSALFLDSDSPYEAALNYAKQYLKPNGVLIIAIENQLGLKYFAGCAEDHSQIPYDGIQGYPSGHGARTFGKKEIEALLKNSGFDHQKFLYPFPDYKMPDVILNLDSMDAYQKNPFIYRWVGYNNSRDYNFQSVVNFQESSVYQQLEKNALMAEMSHSFLILTSVSDSQLAGMHSKEQLAVKYNMNRKKEYMTSVQLTKSSKGKYSVTRNRLYENVKQTPQSDLTHSTPKESYVEGASLIESLIQCLQKGSEAQKELGFEFGRWKQFLLDASSENISGEPHVPGNYIDCLPWNLIEQNDKKLIYIDQEWSFKESLPVSFIMFRGVFHTYRMLTPLIAKFFDQIQPDHSGPLYLSFWKWVEEAIGLDVYSKHESYLKLEQDFQVQLHFRKDLDMRALLADEIPQFELPASHQAMKNIHDLKRLNKGLESEVKSTHARLYEKCVEVERLKDQLQSIQNSPFWKLRGQFVRVKKKLPLWQ